MLPLFYVFATISVIFALGVLILKNPIHCALMLVGTFFCLGGIYVMLNAEFVAVIQVLVYAGAIMVLFLFVLMLLSTDEPSQVSVKWNAGKMLAVIVTLGIFIQIATVFSNSSMMLGEKGNFPLERIEEIGSITLIGQLLFTEYVLPFEIISVLLLVAVIGAVVIAKRKFN
jgi:NADH-quinone oxidoreductase subunit J